MNDKTNKKVCLYCRVSTTDKQDVNRQVNELRTVIDNNGQEIFADNVICNADPPAVYSKLTNSKNLNSFFNCRTPLIAAPAELPKNIPSSLAKR